MIEPGICLFAFFRWSAARCVANPGACKQVDQSIHARMRVAFRIFSIGLLAWFAAAHGAYYARKTRARADSAEVAKR